MRTLWEERFHGSQVQSGHARTPQGIVPEYLFFEELELTIKRR